MGTNGVALILQHHAVQERGISSPPKTFAELERDAKLLTKGHVHGFGIDLSQDGTNYTDANTLLPLL